MCDARGPCDCGLNFDLREKIVDMQGVILKFMKSKPQLTAIEEEQKEASELEMSLAEAELVDEVSAILDREDDGEPDSGTEDPGPTSGDTDELLASAISGPVPKKRCPNHPRRNEWAGSGLCKECLQSIGDEESLDDEGLFDLDGA